MKTEVNFIVCYFAGDWNEFRLDNVPDDIRLKKDIEAAVVWFTEVYAPLNKMFLGNIYHISVSDWG